MPRTFPAAARRVSYVFFSEDPRALPLKSDGFFTTTLPLDNNPISTKPYRDSQGRLCSAQPRE